MRGTPTSEGVCRLCVRETMLWIVGLVGGGLLLSSVMDYIARFG
jgi:hypothetical protein